MAGRPVLNACNDRLRARSMHESAACMSLSDPNFVFESVLPVLVENAKIDPNTAPPILLTYSPWRADGDIYLVVPVRTESIIQTRVVRTVGRLG